MDESDIRGLTKVKIGHLVDNCFIQCRRSKKIHQIIVEIGRIFIFLCLQFLRKVDQENSLAVIRITDKHKGIQGLELTFSMTPDSPQSYGTKLALGTAILRRSG